VQDEASAREREWEARTAQLKAEARSREEELRELLKQRSEELLARLRAKERELVGELASQQAEHAAECDKLRKALKSAQAQLLLDARAAADSLSAADEENRQLSGLHSQARAPSAFS
jgi:hypothetical protein